MANYIYTDSQSQIQFTNVKRNAASIASAPLSSKNNYVISGSTITEKYDNIINAIDIDWNGAKPDIGEGTNGITTTGDLINAIKWPAEHKATTSTIGGIKVWNESSTITLKTREFPSVVGYGNY